MNIVSSGSADALLSIAIDLTASLASRDRLTRLLEAVRRSIPCDAAAVLAPEVQGTAFLPRNVHACRRNDAVLRDDVIQIIGTSSSTSWEGPSCEPAREWHETLRSSWAWHEAICTRWQSVWDFESDPAQRTPLPTGGTRRAYSLPWISSS